MPTCSPTTLIEDIDWTQAAAAQVYPNLEEIPTFITQQCKSAAELASYPGARECLGTRLQLSTHLPPLLTCSENATPTLTPRQEVQ